MYKNPWDTTSVSLIEFAQYGLSASKALKNVVIDNQQDIESELPISIHKEWDKEPTNVGDILYYWIGHSTFLLVIKEEDRIIRILTDPVFGDNASPFWFAFKRYRNVPITVSELPKIDYVIYSHNHYDHLCYTTLLQLEEYHKPIYFTPSSMGDRDLWRMGVPENRYIQLGWHEQHDLGIKFILVPAFHNSGRLGIDRNKTLWGGWVIKTNTRSIYFTGDTAYCPVFKEIGERYGPFDLSLIAIGAGEGRDENDRNFLKRQHINVEEAIKIFDDTNTKVGIGCHHGTFALTAEHPVGPKRKLISLVNDRNFTTMMHGEMRSLV